MMTPTQLMADFEPTDLVRLSKRQAFTPAQRGVFAFLLHISTRFDLARRNGIPLFLSQGDI